MIRCVPKFRGCNSACAFGAVDPLLVLCSSSQRRGGLLACLSRSLSGRASHAAAHRSRRSSSRWRWCIAFLRHSRLRLGVCLWRRRCSVVSLINATGCWTPRAPFALACWLAPPARSGVSRVARRHIENDSLHFCVIRGCISACDSSAVDVRLLRSSSRRRGGLLARLLRSRVGLRLPRRRASLAWLVVTTAIIRCILAPFAVASWRMPMALWLLRSIATSRWTARAPLTLACQLAPPAPSRISRIARRHDGDDSLHSRVICGCISACDYGAVDLRLLRSSSRQRGGSLAHPSRSRVDLRLPRRYAPLAWLVVATAVVHCTLVISWLHFGVCLWRRRCSVASLAIATAWWAARAPLAPACRLTPPAPSHVPRVACRH